MWKKILRKFRITNAFLHFLDLPEIHKRINRIESRIEHAEISHYSFLALNSKECGVNQSKRDHHIVVSLTTFGKRIRDVYLAIESLMNQTLKPDNIVLWLSEDEFTYESLPELLKLQEKRGLSIEFCKDLKSYKKLIPALKKSPDSLIITVDDDFLYPIYHLEMLYKSYLEQPDVIHCHRAHFMHIKNDKIRPYRYWDKEIDYVEVSNKVFPTGGAGALYYPGCFDDEVFNEEVFMTLCPTADDIWFKFMAMKNGVQSKVVKYGLKSYDLMIVPGPQENALYDINISKNDEQINALLNHYPDIEIVFSADFKQESL